MINFSDLHRISAIELRITATDDESGRSKIYPVFASTMITGEALAEKVNAVKARVRKTGLPPEWDSAAEVKAMEAEYSYPNFFRKAP